MFSRTKGRSIRRRAGAWWGECCDRGGQVQVEGVEQGDGAQDVPLVGGEVGEGAGDQGGEVVVEVGGVRGSAGAADFEEPHHRQIEVERKPVGAFGDGVADLGADERLSVAGQAAGEVVVAVLGGEVTDEDLLAGSVRCPGGRDGSRQGQARPGTRSGVVELSLQGRVGPLEAGAAGDDEEAVGHQPHHSLDEALQVAVRPVADVLEGVEEDDRRHRLVGRQPGELVGQQVGVEGQRLEVRVGVQQVREACAAGERAYRLAPLAQRGREGGDDLADGCADGSGQQQCLGDVGECGLHLLAHRFAEPAREAAAVQVLLQALAGVLGLPVAAQGDVEGRQGPAQVGERGADGEDDVLEGQHHPSERGDVVQLGTVLRQSGQQLAVHGRRRSAASASNACTGRRRGRARPAPMGRSRGRRPAPTRRPDPVPPVRRPGPARRSRCRGPPGS
ncbi:hypothetical protein ACFYPN_33330 [Streptomyces sp. NPDC005576]|uniref:hypothetical protein n=1 Tax=Streptomyces sp. NPDC005576 TaxID=3364726 RepID=UPI0036C28E16